MNLSIRGGTVVTALEPAEVRRADVLISGERIEKVGESLDDNSAVLDASGCLVVPGNVNAHMHAYAALARGMPYDLAPPGSFLEILQRIWWRLDRALDPDAVRASALVAAGEALLAGTTTLVDHHASPNAIDGSLDVMADAFATLGIRSLMAYEVTDRDGPERATAGIAENARFLAAIRDHRWPLARGMVGAHASFTLSDETLAACVDLAARQQAGLHIHVAEDEVDRGAARRLGSAGALLPGSLVAHAVHLDEDEAALLRGADVTVAHNPRSNMNNGVGRARLDRLPGRCALGTDGIGADMWAEGRSGFFRRREETLDTSTDWALRELAHGSRFAGRAFGEPLLGRIEPGAPADVVVLDYAAPTPVDSDTLAAHWIFGIGAWHVRDVLVAGEPVVRERRLTRIDGAALAETARREAARLWARLESIEAHPFVSLPHPAEAGTR